jgi:hypothetical protein
MRAIVASDRDPLSEVVGWVLNEKLDIQLRLSAAHICLPYLYPRLNATTVDSRHTIVKVDSGEVLDRLSARIQRLAAPPAIDVEAFTVGRASGIPKRGVMLSSPCCVIRLNSKDVWRFC